VAEYKLRALDPAGRQVGMTVTTSPRLRDRRAAEYRAAPGVGAVEVLVRQGRAWIPWLDPQAV